MQRFPSEKDSLRRLYNVSNSFQALCKDYQKCVEAIEHWTKIEVVQARERTREYNELKQDLEEEIIERINVMW